MATNDSELPSQYDAAATERALYAEWEAAGVFAADPARTPAFGGTHEPFVVLMPPPNVTAALHVGHGLNNSVQDVLVRWRRMCGDEALWVPGTDHAGIATQNIVEKQLAKEGTTRFDIGREAFLARTEAFVETTGGQILHQLRAIGCSADWTRTAYTLSPTLSRAVREVFVRLYEKDLVYRGHRVIHWCPRCLTSLSDEEAEFHDSNGRLFHLRYPVANDPTQGITLATTRPETMLADVAVAVHPEDERYQAFIGKMLTLPLVGIQIPVIADEYVDRTFGTGVVKITPAHDANDFDVGTRHRLAMPVVITADGRMGEVADAAGRVRAEWQGLDRFDARKKIVAALEAEGAMVKIDQHAHSVRRCYRCDTVVEPRLSDQWFVRMKPLAAPALAAVKEGTIRVLPERYEAVYLNWMEGIRDWNISRQLWWGHRVPVWTCTACQHTNAYREDPTACPKCGGALEQDPDVFDTWFSSWLWPVSTLGWPEPDTRDQKAFYPTDVLVTAPEILFFWVARMIMAGYFTLGRAPFHTVYLHGTVRDTQHRKMSKSLGNGIDPLEVVEKFGADALRYTLIAGLGMGVDVILDPADLEKSFAPGRNFATKLWNIGRFLLLQVGDDPVAPLETIAPERLTLADRWILDRLSLAVRECDAALGASRPADGRWPAAERFAGLRLSDHAESARRFVWNELADWYLEAAKTRLAASGDDREVARAVLVHCFDAALRLLHPIMPFITEALWRKLPGWSAGTFVARAAWPTPSAPRGSDAFELARDVVGGIRQLRNEYMLNPGQVIAAIAVLPDAARRAALADEQAMVERLARCTLTITDVAPGGATASVVLAGGTEVVLPLEGLVDLGKERARLGAEHAQLSKQLDALRGRLSNERFVAKAPADVVAAERAKEAEWAARVALLDAKVRALGGVT
ncbi:MAG: valine--tRNA ligase [Gemmatimonadaceae bacterium]|nr:valine--tRNA ligase [Gemmatimonadaceae bacterium]